MSIYLICIYILLGTFAFVSIVFATIILANKIMNNKITIQNLRQKKSALYIKYDPKIKEITINNYTYLNLDISKSIINISKQEYFDEKIKFLVKNPDEKFSCVEKNENMVFNLVFSYREKEDGYIILRCDYSIEKIAKQTDLIDIDEIKKIHSKSDDKNGVLYHLNIKDFNSINQRYSQECGDYILEVIKGRLDKINKKNLYCSYLGADEFVIYYNKAINKKKAFKFIKHINKRLTKPIDIGYINIDLVFGVGICIGKYNELDEFIKCAYVASDYAKKRKKYNVVIYNESMKLEENIISICEEELENILNKKEIIINYTPVFHHAKSKFIGYISNITFDNNLIDYEKIKNVALQKDKIDQFMSTAIDAQLINYIKKRTSKNSKLFLNLKLEDLTTFLEVYLSNQSYSDCKIVICLDVRRGYEMINKFSNISSNISKIIEEGIEFALEVNYSNIYDYDYMLKNANYLIIDNYIINNMSSALIKNKLMNINEVANNYELDLFATDIKEYMQFENLLKQNVTYFSGSYFGKGAPRPNEIEQTKTRIFAKFLKDSKKSKNN